MISKPTTTTTALPATHVATYAKRLHGLHPNLIKTIQDAENYTNPGITDTPFPMTIIQKTHNKLTTAPPKYPVRPTSDARPKTPPPNFANIKQVMIFDVETTGLPPNNMNPEKPETVDLALVPYITQLSFIVYDTETRLITHIFDEYIDIPDDVYISDEITSITGIDRDTLNAKGIPMFYALSVFLQCLKHCDCLVAHNIAFDVRMIRFEMMRYAFCQTGVFDRSMDGCGGPLRPLTLYCTMRNGQSICKLKTATGWTKPPKLSELYFHLFHETVENLHNSIIDVLVCFRCFLKVAYSHHIPPNVFGKFMKFDYEAMYESLETDHSAIVCL